MLKFKVLHSYFIQRLQTAKSKITYNIENVNVKFTQKIEGTFVENWVKYWKNVFIDYRDVAFDVGKDIKEKPLKAAITLSLLGTIVFCRKHNPNEAHFRDAYLNWANKLLLVHPSMQNEISSKHLKYIEKCYNEHCIRRLNVGVASIIWIDYYSDFCSNYESKCPHLQLQMKNFRARIIDIGFFNEWWILNDKMIDYDINY